MSRFRNTGGVAGGPQIALLTCVADGLGDGRVNHLRFGSRGHAVGCDRMQFGRKSEKLDWQIEQLELKLDDLETSRAQRTSASTTSLVASDLNRARKRARQPLPAHLPRETREVPPKQEACPNCGGKLKPLGEDVSEMLEYVPEHFKVIRQVRPKLACARCDKIVQAEAASRPMERGIAGPGLLAHVLVSKYCDHLPLYRQAEIYARVTAWSWIARPWRSGSEDAVGYWSRWWRRCDDM